VDACQGASRAGAGGERQACRGRGGRARELALSKCRSPIAIDFGNKSSAPSECLSPGEPVIEEPESRGEVFHDDCPS